MSSSTTTKFNLQERTSGLGIDLTADSVRLLHLNVADGAFQICTATVIDAETEGILDGQELADALGKWLTDHALTGIRACAALPVMTTTESIFELPPALPPAEISKMVDVQARALGNLSDEAFIHDFQLGHVPKDAQQPVIMEIIRESIVTQHYKLLQEHHASIHQMTSHGLAAVNALLSLHPTESASNSVQLLLNLDDDYSSFSILRGGHLLSQSWLTYSVRQHGSPMPFDVLQTDIAAALERWHETARSNGTDGIPHTLWVTGSGALSQSIHAHLIDAYPWLEIRLFGVPDSFLENTRTSSLPATDENGLHPELTVAFGLAVQAVGAAPISVSLLPPLARWQQERMATFPLLVVTVAVLVFGMLALCMGLGFRMRAKEARIANEIAALETCKQLVPKLDKAREKLDFHQKQLLPLVEAGSRTQRFMEALTIWNKALDDETDGKRRQNWGIFFADEQSFNFVNSERTTKAEKNRSPQPNELDYDMTTRLQDDYLPHQELSPMLMGQQPAGGMPQRQPLTLVTDIPVLKNLYVGGITPLGESRYKVVKEIQTRLLDSGVYVNVDDHIDFLIKPFSDRYFLPWLEFLKDNKQALGNDYTIFFLQLPLKQEVISTAALAQAAAEPKKRKK